MPININGETISSIIESEHIFVMDFVLTRYVLVQFALILNEKDTLLYCSACVNDTGSFNIRKH